MENNFPNDSADDEEKREISAQPQESSTDFFQSSEEPQERVETTEPKQETEPKKLRRQVVYKILVAGDASVGKSTMIHRYVEGEFVDTKTMTIGVDFYTKKLNIGDDILCVLQIWDLGGQERFRFMIDAYLRGAHAALLLFDTTSMKSFVNIQKWNQLLRKDNREMPIILVGTKKDLEEFSMVADYYAELTAKRLKLIDYVQTSSKWGLNVNNCFENMVKYLLEREA